MKGIAILSLAALAAIAAPASKTFTIIGDKLAYRNLATFESAAEFESISGKTNIVSGAINFDPAAKKGSGKVSIDVASIDTGIGLRNQHLQSDAWLDAKKYPSIDFVATSVKPAGGDNYRVTGKFSLHGVTKTVTANVTLKYRAFSDEVKKAGFSGDVVQIKTKFNVRLSDFGVKIPDMDKGKLSNDVVISLSTYGIAK